MSWPWETRTSTCRNFATISSGLYRFLAIAVLLDVETYLKSDHFVGGGSQDQRHFEPHCARRSSPARGQRVGISERGPNTRRNSRWRRTIGVNGTGDCNGHLNATRVG